MINKIVIARKDTNCDLCKLKILKGEPYKTYSWGPSEWALKDTADYKPYGRLQTHVICDKYASKFKYPKNADTFYAQETDGYGSIPDGEYIEENLLDFVCNSIVQVLWDKVNEGKIKRQNFPMARYLKQDAIKWFLDSKNYSEKEKQEVMVYIEFYKAKRGNKPFNQCEI